MFDVYAFKLQIFLVRGRVSQLLPIMKSIAVLFVGTSAVQAQQPSFEEWTASYGINGADDAMKVNYEANVAKIDGWNVEEIGATFAVNEFSGMSFDEFSAMYLTATDEDLDAFDNSSFVESVSAASAGGAINWVGRGKVTPVKNQGGCGSCWAFSTIAGIEAVHKIHTGRTVDLAEQQLVDCSPGTCKGGNVGPSLNYLKGHAPCTTLSYQYTGNPNGRCKSCNSAGIRVSGMHQFPNSESGLESALQGSPASVTVMADDKLQHYKSGVLRGSSVCTLNHAVLAVGYDGKSWKIKNSWGLDWGEHGYGRIEAGVGGCGAYGIAYRGAIVPTVSVPPPPSGDVVV